MPYEWNWLGTKSLHKEQPRLATKSCQTWPLEVRECEERLMAFPRTGAQVLAAQDVTGWQFCVTGTQRFYRAPKQGKGKQQAQSPWLFMIRSCTALRNLQQVLPSQQAQLSSLAELKMHEQTPAVPPLPLPISAGNATDEPSSRFHTG